MLSVSGFEVLAAPGVHQHLLVTCNSLFFNFGWCIWVSHQISHFLFNVKIFKELFSRRIESTEFSEIETSDSFDTIIIWWQAIVNYDSNQTQIALSIKQHTVFLPELFSVTWSPSQLSSMNLVSKLLERTEYFLICFKEFIHLLEHLVNIIIDPMSILKLYNKAQSVYVRQMLLTNLIFLQVIEKHQHDSCNLFPWEKV